MDAKTLTIQELVAAVGEEEATVIQQIADDERAEHFEQWFRSDILGHKSTFQPE